MPNNSKNSLRSFEDFPLIWEFPMIDIILLVFYHFPQKLTHELHCLVLPDYLGTGQPTKYLDAEFINA